MIMNIDINEFQYKHSTHDQYNKIWIGKNHKLSMRWIMVKVVQFKIYNVNIII